MANCTNHPPSRMRHPDRTNTSGIRGVSFVDRNGARFVSVSYFDEHGIQRNTQRSIDKHGIEAALKHALKMRRKCGAKHVPTLAQAIAVYDNWSWHP